MKICIAQLRPVKGDISANVGKHEMLMLLAAKLEAAAIFFPELSLTAYEPELAEDLASSQDDPRLDVFQQISDDKKMVIGLGLPTRTGIGVQISMIIFQPHQERQSYSKQQLHADELPYFVHGDKQAILIIDNMKIAPAICYESLQMDHAEEASRLGAEIYLASVAKSQSGINKAMSHYPVVARRFSMPVLMANCVGYCDNFYSFGTSSVWTKHGELVGQLGSDHEGLLVFDTETEDVIEHRGSFVQV